METNSMTVAETILAQLGGSRFIAMTGAREFIGDGETLWFRIPKNQSKAQRVEVRLTDRDDYTVRYLRWDSRKLEWRETIPAVEGIQAGELRRAFTLATGFLTSL